MDTRCLVSREKQQRSWSVCSNIKAQMKEQRLSKDRQPLRSQAAKKKERSPGLTPLARHLALFASLSLLFSLMALLTVNMQVPYYNGRTKGRFEISE